MRSIERRAATGGIDHGARRERWASRAPPPALRRLASRLLVGHPKGQQARARRGAAWCWLRRATGPGAAHPGARLGGGPGV